MCHDSGFYRLLGDGEQGHLQAGSIKDASLRLQGLVLGPEGELYLSISQISVEGPLWNYTTL